MCTEEETVSASSMSLLPTQLQYRGLTAYQNPEVPPPEDALKQGHAEVAERLAIICLKALHAHLTFSPSSTMSSSCTAGWVQ